MKLLKSYGLYCIVAAICLQIGCQAIFISNDTKQSPKPNKTSDQSKSDEPNQAEQSRVRAIAHYATGLFYELQQDSQAAIEEYYKSATNDPSNEPLVIELARRFLQKSDNSKAIELLKSAEKLPSSSGLINAWLSLAYLQTGKTNESIEQATIALKKKPDAILARQCLVHAYIQQKKPSKATRVLDEAEKVESSDPYYWLDLAGLYLNAKSELSKTIPNLNSKVVKILEKIKIQDISDPIMLQKLAESYNLCGETTKAIEIYLKLLNSFPQLSIIRQKLTELYLRSGNKAKALEQLEFLVKNNPAQPNAYYILGSLAAEDKQYKKAIDYFKNAIILDPENEPAYYELAATLLIDANPEEALEVLAKARQKFQQSFPLEFYTGLALTRLKNYTEALKHFTAAEILAKATAPNQLNAFFYFQLGATYERTKNLSEAEKYFRKCIELSPNDAEAFNYLGYMWAENGINLKEAHEFISKALALEPDNPAYLDSMAWVLFKLGKPDEALQYIEKAVKLSKEPDPVIYDHLGDILSTLGRKKEAKQAWQKALDLEPNEQIKVKIDAAP
jgi:tetratricopeptide (TPR) repeat protein